MKDRITNKPAAIWASPTASIKNAASSALIQSPNGPWCSRATVNGRTSKVESMPHWPQSIRIFQGSPQPGGRRTSPALTPEHEQAVMNRRGFWTACDDVDPPGGLLPIRDESLRTAYGAFVANEARHCDIASESSSGRPRRRGSRLDIKAVSEGLMRPKPMRANHNDFTWGAARTEVRSAVACGGGLRRFRRHPQNHAVGLAHVSRPFLRRPEFDVARRQQPNRAPHGWRRSRPKLAPRANTSGAMALCPGFRAW